MNICRKNTQWTLRSSSGKSLVLNHFCSYFFSGILTLLNQKIQWKQQQSAMVRFGQCLGYVCQCVKAPGPMSSLCELSQSQIKIFHSTCVTVSTSVWRFSNAEVSIYSPLLIFYEKALTFHSGLLTRQRMKAQFSKKWIIPGIFFELTSQRREIPTVLIMQSATKNAGITDNPAILQD